jgi:hypothetical protein
MRRTAHHDFEPLTTEKPGVRWHDMPDIPPILVVRMKLMSPKVG